jgi:hypothetical protein
MSKELPIEHKCKIMEQYLGDFFTDMTSEEVQEHRALFGSKFETALVYGSRSQLLKVGFYFLICELNRLDYEVVYTYDILDTQFNRRDYGEEETPRPIAGGNVPYYIVYHPSAIMSTSVTEDLLCGAVYRRHLKRLPTLFLSEQPLPKVDHLFNTVIQRPPIVMKKNHNNSQASAKTLSGHEEV